MKVDEITEGWFDFARGAMNPRKHLAPTGPAAFSKSTPAGVEDPYLHNELLKMGDEALAGGKARVARMTPDVRAQIDKARKDQGATAIDWATLDNPEPPKEKTSSITPYGAMAAQASPAATSTTVAPPAKSKSAKMSMGGQATASFSGAPSYQPTPPPPPKPAAPPPPDAGSSVPGMSGYVYTGSMGSNGKPSAILARKYYNSQFQKGLPTKANR